MKFGMKKEARGGVGIRIIFIIISVTIIFAAILWMLQRHQQTQERFSRKATEISEIGIQSVMERLGQNPSWREGFSKNTYEDGWYSASLETKNVGDTVFLIVESVGHCGPISKRQGSVLRLSVTGADSSWIRSDSYEP